MTQPQDSQEATAVRVACVQMISCTDIQKNIHAAAELIAQAASDGAQLIVLPEYFCLMGRLETDKLAVAEDFVGEQVSDNTPLQAFLRAQAMQHQIYLIGGTIPLKSPDPRKVYNSCLVYSPEGRVEARYDKIHLFGFKNADESYNEGDAIMAGDATQPCVWDSPWGQIGIAICYDIRFPELFRQAGDVVAWIVMAAFTHTTGQAHWEVLLRARAIENQCYLAASGQGGLHENGRRTFGHSMWIDPWGAVQSVQPEGCGVVFGNLLHSRIHRVRTSLPALKHRVMSC
ncbi:carbon-nitrogen hydrolase family protein [Hydromonas duriensis]|uniref:Nitrilase n=1 Tax=Hydromonas duriensis TaxID=1527608 RepID=A0A4R6Y6E2_9BURK|nr:carbon-nitrogen hydrolase family protein [Hydromonas duriensis]TDR31079.1 nitrilase [Hydromonas duriensis]